MPLTINLKAEGTADRQRRGHREFGHACQDPHPQYRRAAAREGILTEEQATTPARRIYFAIQCEYLFPGKESLFLPIIYEFLRQFAEAAPSAIMLVREIGQFVDAGEWYER